MQLTALLLHVWLASVAAAPTAPPQITLNTCLVSLIQEARVPARQAGVLVELAVREGQTVAKDALLARIDDTQAQLGHKAASLNLRVALEQARDDVNVRYAVAALKVAQAELRRAEEANAAIEGTVPEAEMDRLRLTCEKLQLEIERARMDQRIAGLQSWVKDAEVQAAAETLRRHQITAPFDGVVVEIFPHVGEWLEPGTPVVYLIEVDRLRVEGFVDQETVGPGEIAGCDVEVVVSLERGRQERFSGKVVFVDPRLQAGKDYRVWAEVDNRQENGAWLLRPGQKAQMTIFLK